MTHDSLDTRLRKRTPARWSGMTTPPGWDKLIDELDRDLAAICPEYRLYQAKAKFGGLRYYTNAHDQSDDVMDAMVARIDRAEHASLKTCEYCGEPGRNRRRSSGWWVTACDEHVEKRSGG